MDENIYLIKCHECNNIIGGIDKIKIYVDYFPHKYIEGCYSDKELEDSFVCFKCNENEKNKYIGLQEYRLEKYKLFLNYKNTLEYENLCNKIRKNKFNERFKIFIKGNFDRGKTLDYLKSVYKKFLSENGRHNENIDYDRYIDFKKDYYNDNYQCSLNYEYEECLLSQSDQLIKSLFESNL